MEHPTGDASPAASWLKRNMNWLVLTITLALIALPRLSPFEGLNEYLNVFQRLSEWTLETLQRLFKDYGYYVVFLGVLAENSMFLGLLVPGAIIIILGGLSAENGDINFWFVVGLAIIATIIGDTISYFIGRMGWTKALERGSFGEMLNKVRGPMEANSTWLILAYHFAGYSRVVGPAAAGLFRVPYRRWAPLDYTGGTLWVITFALVGYMLGVFGVEFDDTKSMVRLIEIFLTIGLVVMIVLAFTRTRQSREPSAPASSRPAPVAVRAESDD